MSDHLSWGRRPKPTCWHSHRKVQKNVGVPKWVLPQRARLETFDETSMWTWTIRNENQVWWRDIADRATKWNFVAQQRVCHRWCKHFSPLQGPHERISIIPESTLIIRDVLHPHVQGWSKRAVCPPNNTWRVKRRLSWRKSHPRYPLANPL